MGVCCDNDGCGAGVDVGDEKKEEEEEVESF